MQAQRIWPVLLSGGAGTRLWPLSRQALPKQLIAFVGSQTMLQASAARVADPARFEPPIVVGNDSHARMIIEQLAEIGISPALILEPWPRNTAPAIALAALEIARRDPAAVVLVLPSDHLVLNVDAFLQAVGRASIAAQEGWLVTLGINAEAPETGYGYIEVGAQLFEGVNKVVRFIEKPDRAAAEAYVASGCFTWNGGYLVARVDALIAAIGQFEPELLEYCANALDHARRDGRSVQPDADSFAGCASQSFDHAILERAANVAVVPVSMGWSDIGSWDALKAVGPHDSAGNSLTGRVIAIDTHRCLIFGDGPIVATIGVHDINVVATRDAVLITAAGSSQDVKAVVARLDGDPALVEPASHATSWGRRRRLTGGDGLSVEEITIVAGAYWPDASGELTILAGSVELDGLVHEVGARLTVTRAAVKAVTAATLLRIAGPVATGDPELFTPQPAGV